MQSFNISFQLFREFCKGQLFNTCQHPGNGHQSALHSCCANFCPVMEEAKRRQAAEEFNNDLTTQVKSFADATAEQICRCVNKEYWIELSAENPEHNIRYCPECGKLLLT